MCCTIEPTINLASPCDRLCRSVWRAWSLIWEWSWPRSKYQNSQKECRYTHPAIHRNLRDPVILMASTENSKWRIRKNYISPNYTMTGSCLAKQCQIQEICAITRHVFPISSLWTRTELTWSIDQTECLHSGITHKEVFPCTASLERRAGNLSSQGLFQVQQGVAGEMQTVWYVQSLPYVLIELSFNMLQPVVGHELLSQADAAALHLATWCGIELFLLLRIKSANKLNWSCCNAVLGNNESMYLWVAMNSTGAYLPNQ